MKLKEIDIDKFEKELDGKYVPTTEEEKKIAHENGLASVHPVIDNFDALELGQKILSYKIRKGDEEFYNEFGEGCMTFGILVKLVASIDEIPDNEKSLFIITIKLMDDVDSLRYRKGIGRDEEGIFVAFKRKIKEEAIVYNYVVYLMQKP